MCNNVIQPSLCNNMTQSPLYYSYYLQYNSHYDVVVSVDTTGMVEYWRGPAGSYCFPRNIKFDLKIDTDLYEFVKVRKQE